jgi:hypothetical protein
MFGPLVVVFGPTDEPATMDNTMEWSVEAPVEQVQG